MNVTIPKIREYFPNTTPEEKLIIGSECLTLSNDERREILSVAGGVRSWLTDKNYYAANLNTMEAIAKKVDQAVFKGKIIGGSVGALTGAVGGGAAAWKVTNSTLPTIGGAIAGGVVGGYVGYKVGGNKALELSINELESSPEFLTWQAQKLDDFVFPALTRFYPENKLPQITCQIYQTAMRMPVFAPDGQYYEKEAIEAHLDTQEKLRFKLESKGETYEVDLQSPIRRCPISKSQLEFRPNIYRNIIPDLILNYNKNVTRHLEIGQKVRGGEITEEEISQMSNEEQNIVRFYQLSPQARRRVAIQLGNKLNEQLEMEDETFSTISELLNQAACPPTLI